jgi:hypothetical protein
MRPKKLQKLVVPEDEPIVLMTVAPLDNKFPAVLSRIGNALPDSFASITLFQIADQLRYRHSRRFWHAGYVPSNFIQDFKQLLHSLIRMTVESSGTNTVLLISNFGTRHLRELNLQLLVSEFQVAYVVPTPSEQDEEIEVDIAHSWLSHLYSNPVFEARQRLLFSPPDAQEIKDLCVPVYTC